MTTSIYFFTYGQSVQRSVICVNGNYTSNGDIQVSQTIGEPIAETFNGPDITTFVVQGFEQQFGSLLNVGVIDLNLEVSIYPNPTSDYVYINFINEIPTHLSLQVFGIDGKHYFYQELSRQTRIDLKNLAAGTYFLRFIDNETKHYLNSITIQKIK